MLLSDDGLFFVLYGLGGGGGGVVHSLVNSEDIVGWNMNWPPILPHPPNPPDCRHLCEHLSSPHRQQQLLRQLLRHLHLQFLVDLPRAWGMSRTLSTTNIVVSFYLWI